MKLLDSHAHLTDEKFAQDLDTRGKIEQDKIPQALVYERRAHSSARMERCPAEAPRGGFS